jgi:hypothetical protein
MTSTARTEVPAFLEPLSVDAVRRELVGQGEIHLQSFSALELAAVAARSPVRGLLASPEMLALDDAAVVAGMILALQSLAIRGLVGMTLTKGGHGEEDRSITMPLGGELAMVTAIRRRPPLIGVVSIRSSGAERPPEALPSEGVVAILHGVAIEGEGLVGLLEESTSPDSRHHFVMNTPPRQAERILRIRDALDAHPDANPVQPGDRFPVISVDLFVPSSTQPMHTRLVLTNPGFEGGEATVFKLATSEEGIQETRIPLVDVQQWTSIFEECVRLER